jgi:2-oxoglutarate dehydrogenase E2 component (dihydrolipoamide succinyltransferase)
MAMDVIMPQMGESIFEGTITKWLKKAGDTVQKDEPLFEISTDKVDAEIPSPVAGVLAEIKVPEGATVQVNTVVAVVTESGEKQGTEGRDQGSVAPAAPQAPPQAQAAPPQAGSTEVVMPQMGESIFEGTITKWLKKIGDTVQKDEPLFEISTDKVDAEIPSPVAGVLTEIKVAEGATVQINTVVATIGGVSGAADRGVGASASVPAAPVSASTAVPAAIATSAPLLPVNGSERIRSSPLVRRMAKDNRLDLRQIAGTGSKGRITKDDLLRHLSQHGPGSNAPAATSAAPKVPLIAPQAQSNPPEVVVPMTKMRAIIAQRMVESVQTSPHVHTVYKVDMTRIVRLRQREKAKFEQRNGVKLTFMPFIAAAAVEALRKFPIVNASLHDNSIHYHANINLGIAVALEWGLIVPVVKQAEDLSFLGLARTIADLAARARTKKLMPDEVAGSTFTLTNSGVFGDEFSTPLINQPNSAILGISGLNKEAVVLTDAEGNDTLAIRSMQHFCLGFDHRLIDGADGCKFMATFKKTLEEWDKEIG